jgi:hypothetical protein
LTNKTHIAAASTALIVTVVLAASPVFFQLDNTGTIYVPTPNIACSINTLNWGDKIYPSAILQKQVNFTNTGDKQTAPLVMIHTCTVGTFRWNLEGYIIKPNQTLTATFTLTVDEDPPNGDFQFTITVIG